MKFESVPLGKVCMPTRMRDPRRNPDRPFLYVDISSIDRGLKLITTAPEIIGAKAPSRARKEIRKGDVLVSTVRPNLNAVAIVPPELDRQIASTGFCVLRTIPSAIEGKYLYYFTITPDFVGILSTKVRGAHYPAVSDSDVKKIKVPLPPLSEQRRIVEILDQADVLRKNRAEADAKAARILPALFYKIFGDPATNPKGWRFASLGEVISETRNGLYKPVDFYGSGIGILKMFNIQNGELDLTRVDLIDLKKNEIETYRLVPGDILINRVNTPDLVGKCAVITDEVAEAVFESKNIRLRVKTNKVTPEFVAAYLNSSFGHGTLKSGVKHAIGMATINNADLRRIPIPLPPLEHQQEWACVVNNMRSICKKTTISRENIDSLFQNLLSRAFTGDLTAKWREAHMKELLDEMKKQSKSLET